MKFRHSFIVNAPLEETAAFHSRPASMAAITPPPIRVELHSAPEELKDGDEMEFTLKLGPFPVRWLAKIESSSPTGFTDRQVQGPFATWVHRHDFLPLGEGRTQVLDRVELTLSPHTGWRLVGLGMALGLPFLFGYRGWKTRQLLAG